LGVKPIREGEKVLDPEKTASRQQDKSAKKLKGLSPGKKKTDGFLAPSVGVSIGEEKTTGQVLLVKNGHEKKNTSTKRNVFLR